MRELTELQDHFFRHESGRLIAALTRVFGIYNLALAEDVVQDAFCRALDVWKVQGVPDNPSAWLMSVAKNRAVDTVRRGRTARRFAPELGRLLDTEWTLAPLVEESFFPHTIRDEQLRMMFSCCQPSVSEPVQIALILNILCGFGVSEIAEAFLVGRPAVEKRLSRGKTTLARAKGLFGLGDATFSSRLSTVQRALYLLFNEGYHGASVQGAVRVELCQEAMRLTALLREHPPAATPTTNALASLMCLHAARLPARANAAGELSSLVEQDRSSWDRRLAAEGLALLEESAAGTDVSSYHLEAAIAAVHAGATSVDDTDFTAIVSLYDRLLDTAPSPVVALNRAIAIGKRDGPAAGLAAIAAIAGPERLSSYPFYHAALGEFELARSRKNEAAAHFRTALGVARNESERRFLLGRLERCVSQEHER